MKSLGSMSRAGLVIAAISLSACGGSGGGGDDAPTVPGSDSPITITAGTTSLTGTLAGSCSSAGYCITYFGSSYDDSAAVSLMSSECTEASGTWGAAACSTDAAIGHCLTDATGDEAQTSYLDMVIFSDYPWAGSASEMCAANDPSGTWESFP